MFYQNDPKGYRQLLDGVAMKTLVHGKRTLMTEMHFKKGSQLPSHQHPHEQTGYLLEGHIQLTIGNKQLDARPGDSWCIPGDTEHSAIILEDTRLIEIFSPVREDYLPGAEHQIYTNSGEASDG